MWRTIPALLFVLFLSLNAAPPTRAALPVVEDVDPKPLEENCRQVIEALAKLRSPLPAETRQALDRLRAHEKPDDVGPKIQKLLDPYCLIGVSINPESRVKAARGPARAELRQDVETFFLVKVQNDAGVNHALKLASPQRVPATASEVGQRPARGQPERWLEASLYTAGSAATLNGQKVQYAILRLKARTAGKREATLAFDVGQGTQDLGFRAEVPVLFTVRP